MYMYNYIDVVRAYKGVIKEKEALEASLKALSQARVATATEVDSDGGKEREEESQGRGVQALFRSIDVNLS